MEPRQPVKSHHTTNFTQEIYWERNHPRVAASAQIRNTKELSKRKTGFLLEFMKDGNRTFQGDLELVEFCYLI